MTALKFGTDGWRGVIAEDFTFENARIVAQSIARYVVRCEDARKGVIIGYDHRFASDGRGGAFRKRRSRFVDG
jgi:phosphomannomutase